MFLNRFAAGRLLAEKLGRYADDPGVVVLGLPRGGVPVAYEIAKALRVQLDVFVVRKLGVPGEEELAMGAIASGGVRVLNQEIISYLAIRDVEIEEVAGRELQELERRERLYRGNRGPLALTGKTVLLADDGLATGSTMRAAITALRRYKPARTVVAVPVGAADTCRSVAKIVDEIVCLETPEPFNSVGVWYEDFAQTSDEDVRDLLRRGSYSVGVSRAGSEL